MSNQQNTELSERELDILKLVATGASNKEIAQKLFISSNTVKVHLRNIFTKINAASRTEAAMYAVRMGLVENQPAKIAEEMNGTTTSELTDQAIEEAPTKPSKQTISRKAQLARWSVGLILIILAAFISMNWLIDQGYGFFTKPTPTFLPPPNTPTPIPHWKESTPLLTPRSNLALVSYENKIYVIGGLGPDGVLNGVETFDPLLNSWSTLATKPIPVYDAHGAVINGLIYVPGGRPITTDMKPIKNLEIYDTTINTWKKGASLPIPLSGYGLVSFEGHLFVFGGWDGEKYRDDVYSYDPTADSWQKFTSMPTARAFSGATEAGGKIYVIGGTLDGQPVNVNEIYSPSRDHDGNNPWEIGFPIPENRSKVEAATLADIIYVFGSDETSSNQVGLIYFPQNDSWQSLEPAPKTLGADFGMIANGTNLFFIGGRLGDVLSNQNVTYQAIITFSIPIIIK